MDLQLQGKRALVTGASRGLGFAVALGLAREGCQVAINGRNEANLTAAVQRLQQEGGGGVLGLVGDVSEVSTPARLVAETAHAFGGLDLLVTNAGGPPAGAFESFTEEDWQRAVNLAFLSHVRLIRAALPYLRQSSAASVLTITSYAVKQPIPNLVLSNSVRAATVGLTKSLALELGAQGIRFNSILPGWTETERVRELMAFRARQNGTTIEEEFARQSSESPLGRMARPAEFANVAIFLLSPAASYLTGLMITVDGGMYKGLL